MEDTVRTRWSRDWIVAAGAEVLAILLNWWTEEDFRRLTAGLRMPTLLRNLYVYQGKSGKEGWRR